MGAGWQFRGGATVTWKSSIPGRSGVGSRWRRQVVRWGSPRKDRPPEVVICDPEAADLIRTALGAGVSEARLPLRAWWLMYQGDPSPAQVVRYFLTRRPWIEVGSTDVVVFRAEGAAQKLR